MVEVVWTNRSLDRIESSASFISARSIQNARQFVKAVFARVEKVKSHPRTGRIVPEFQIEWLREVFTHNHRIVYSLKEEGKLTVLTVFSSRMQFPTEDVKGS